MGFLAGLKRSVAPLVKDYGSASLPAGGFLPMLGATPSATGLSISQGTAMGVSAVYACVTIRSQDVARCTPRLYKKDRDSDGKRVQVFDHPLAKIFRNPNRVQTYFEWAEQTVAAYLLRGNSYSAKKRDSRGQLTELIPINPDAVLVMESWNGDIFYNVNRLGLWQIAMLRDFPPTMAAEDILHLRGLSFNALVAASTIGLARDAIGLAMGLEQQAARLMANGSRPSGVLQAKKQLDEAAAQRLKKSWQDLTQGVGATGTTAVLEDGIEWKQLQLTSVDAEFMGQRNFQPLDIARFYRVPPHKLGIVELRGVNIVQMDQDYVSNTIMPDLHRIEQKFAKDFDLDAEGLEVDMDETALLRADIQTRYNAARIGLLSGFLSPNEVRAGEGLPPVEGGDEVWRPLNMAALGSDATGTAPDGAGHPSAAEGGVPGADNVPTHGVAADDEERAAIDMLTRRCVQRIRQMRAMKVAA